ncbi:MAG: AbrB/MazE/SpoVT family DNA-binding domain-containing protein [Acidobacteriota bacterium]
MAKVTSKLQVTIPKAIADRYGIAPGEEIDFQPAGPWIRLVPPGVRQPRFSRQEALRVFDENQALLEERWRAEGIRDVAVASVDSAPRWPRESFYEERMQQLMRNPEWPVEEGSAGEDSD